MRDSAGTGGGGIRSQERTGTLWRIRRTEGERGDVPPPAREMPVNAIRAGLAGGAVAAGVGVVKADAATMTGRV